MSSAKVENLTSLPIWMLLFLFVAWFLRLGLLVLCWIAVVRVDIPVMFLILEERLPVFPHWEWYMLWAFHRWLLRCWRMFPLSLHSEEFWSAMDAVFCQMLSLHLLRGSYCSCFFSCWWFITLIVLRVLNQPCIPGKNPTWSWWIVFLMYCWILLASILLRIFACVFIRDIGL